MQCAHTSGIIKRFARATYPHYIVLSLSSQAKFSAMLASDCTPMSSMIGIHLEYPKAGRSIDKSFKKYIFDYMKQQARGVAGAGKESETDD